MTSEDERQRMGARLREQRDYFGYTQGELAGYLGIPRSAVSQIEQGKRRVDVQELRKIAELYGCTVAFLINEPSKDDAAGLSLVARATQGLSKADQQEILRFAQYLKDRKRSDNE